MATNADGSCSDWPTSAGKRSVHMIGPRACCAVNHRIYSPKTAGSPGEMGKVRREAAAAGKRYAGWARRERLFVHDVRQPGKRHDRAPRDQDLLAIARGTVVAIS